MPQSHNSIRSADADKIKTPKNEVRWVTYCNEAGDPRFLITSKPTRDIYFLYEVQNDGSLKRLSRSTSPGELEEEFNVRERFRED